MRGELEARSGPSLQGRMQPCPNAKADIPPERDRGPREGIDVLIFVADGEEAEAAVARTRRPV